MEQHTVYDDNYNKQHQYDFVDKRSQGLFLSKVFGVMFLCLLITTAVAAGLGYGLMYLFTNAADEAAKINITYTMVGLMIGSAIILLIMSFVLPLVFLRGKHNIIVPLMIYVTVMGVLLSSFTWLFEPIILVEAFGVTSLIFGVMAFLGYISKGRLAGLWVVMLGLIVGAGILSLFNFLSILFGGVSEANVTISWIVSLAIFAFLMLMTMWDVWRIKQIAGNGQNSGNNLVYYCAYILYTDFISLLIRVIYYIAILRGRR